MAAQEAITCDVCIVGLGVSSLPLIKELEKSGSDYRVVTSTAFGIWQKLDAAGENFDLVTTIESTNYSWWDYEYDFPFYTASGYYEKLKNELTDSIMSKVVFQDVSRIVKEGSRHHVIGTDGRTLASCAHLVHSIGFSPDSNILSNLAAVSKDASVGKHFLIFGFSDTTNMYISRLVRAGHRVTIACRHFHVVDKIGSTHGNVGGPFDQYEPMQHWAGTSAAPNITGMLVPMPISGAKPGSPGWIIGKVASYVADLVGLNDVVDLRRFDTDVQNRGQGLVNRAKVEVPGGLGYLVKQWPVDEYARYYNDPKYRSWMLEQGIYLNDIYFFLQQGLAKVYRYEEVKLVSGNRYLVAGEPVEFDEVVHCSEARHKFLEVQGGRPYSYADHLHGIWNRENPHVYYLGTTRPYTGAFGCIAEVSSLFVHRMITNSRFHSEMIREFPAHMHSQRVLHNCVVSEPDKLHVQWAGMHCLRIAKTLECDLSYTEAKKRSLVLEWKTGPINALRCRICGPYAVPGAAARYKKSCARLKTHYMYFNMLYRAWGDQMVVASWFMTFMFCQGFRLLAMTQLEQLTFFCTSIYLASKSTMLSDLRGLVLMLAFDNLYHKRAWVMLLSNVLQLLFSYYCICTGDTHGVPLLVRLGVLTDFVFLLLGWLSYPRAFFGDLRVRKPFADWFFKVYLPQNTRPPE